MPLIWFVVVGVVGTAALFAASFLPWRWWWRALLALAVTVIVAVLLSSSGPVQLGNEWWFNTSPYRELILFALMLVGMAARVLSLAIEQRKTENEPAGLRVNRWDFIYPMLFAVPTFGALLSQLNAETMTLPNIVLSFQTGFFWQTILKRAEAK